MHCLNYMNLKANKSQVQDLWCWSSSVLQVNLIPIRAHIPREIQAALLLEFPLLQLKIEFPVQQLNSALWQVNIKHVKAPQSMFML